MQRADKRKYHYIYKITRFDGKYYIGMHSTNNLEDGYFGSGKKITRSIKKYGLEKHSKEILEHFQCRESLRLKEEMLVNQDLLNDPLCMNIALGGGDGWEKLNAVGANLYGKNGLPGYGGQNLLHGKAQIDRLKEKGTYEQYVLKMSKSVRGSISKNGFWWTGRKLTEEHKNNLIKTQKERGHQQGSRNSNFGKKNKCVSKNGVTKRIQISELDNYLQDGWVQGIKK